VVACRSLALILLPCPALPCWSLLTDSHPMLMMDVPRLLRMEYHKRLQMARGKRQHELEALVKSGKLPVGHCRVSAARPAHAWFPAKRQA
jgi:hypothetical protein